MIKNIKMIFKLCGLIWIMLIATGLALVIYPLIPYKLWINIVRNSITAIRKTCRIQLEIVGKANSDYRLKNTIVVANHISWLDTVILYSVYFINFVGKVEMKKWPFLRTIIKSGGTIFINRQNKRHILEINRIISQELQKGRCIGLFPEGGVSDGRHLKPFKAPLLEAAIMAKSTIVPIILVYYHQDGAFAYEVSYNGLNLWQNVTATLKLDRLVAKAIVLEPIQAGNFESRQQLSSYLYQVMDEVYQLREKS